MLLEEDNPYRGGVPESVSLSLDDFRYRISERNLHAVGHRAKWTVFVYGAADKALAEAMFDNLLELKNAGSSDDVHLCAFFNGPLVTDCFFARLNRGTSMSDDIIARFLDVNSTDHKILREVLINYSVLYPAERTLLVLSGHGFGWLGGLTHDETWREMNRLGAISLPVEGIDYALRENNLCCQEMLRSVKSRFGPEEEFHGARFDIMALDQCNMGNLETLATFHDLAGVLIASEDEVPASGYAYDSVVRQILARPELSAADVAESLVHLTSSRVKGKYGPGTPGTQAAFRTAQLQGLCDLIVPLAQQLTEAVTTDAKQVIHGCIGNTWKQGWAYKDLRGLVSNLLDEDIPEGLHNACRALDEFMHDSGFLLACEAPGGRYTPNGISIYLPPPEQFDPRYIEASNHLPLGLGIWIWFLGAYYLQILPPADAEKHPLLEAFRKTAEAAAHR